MLKDAWAGFPQPPPAQQMARQRTTLALIATAALAVSTVIAVTVVSIGIARAETLAGATGGGDSQFSLALLLGIFFAGMGGLAAVTAMHNARERLNR